MRETNKKAGYIPAGRMMEMDNKMVFEWVEQCQACKGTGLYVGIAERDGVAVVCHTCRGTGRVQRKHEYEEFTGRKEREGVERVLEVNPGIIVGKLDGTLEWAGGMVYAEWLSGKGFTPGMEMREHTCPAWWYQRSDHKRKPKWDECGFGLFSSCPHFNNKERCWERWDKEYDQAG